MLKKIKEFLCIEYPEDVCFYILSLLSLATIFVDGISAIVELMSR